MSLEIKLTQEAENEWLFEIDGDGELDGECHVMLLLSTAEVEQLKKIVTAA